MKSALLLAADGVYRVAVELHALDGLLRRSLEQRSSVLVEVCQGVACCSQFEGCCNSPTSKQ